MSPPAPTRYEVLLPVGVGGGKVLWVRVGRAERHPDGSIDAVVEAAIPAGQLRLAETASPDEEETAPGTPRARRHLA